MNNIHIAKTVTICMLAWILLLGGCFINIGGCCNEKFQRTEAINTPMQPGLTLSVHTDYGSIKITGTDSNTCGVSANINGQAPTQEEAKLIADQTKIKFQQQGNVLKVVDEKPELKHDRSVSIDYTITVPSKTIIDSSSSYGSIELQNLKGSFNAVTSYGNITFIGIEGNSKLRTSYGSINCQMLNFENLNANSSYGNINIKCDGSEAKEINADVFTSYGSIDFQSPRGFAGQIVAETSYETINIALPITISGKIKPSKINGTVGTGKGKLNLYTSFGAINIR